MLTRRDHGPPMLGALSMRYEAMRGSELGCQMTWTLMTYSFFAVPTGGAGRGDILTVPAGGRTGGGGGAPINAIALSEGGGSGVSGRMTPRAGWNFVCTSSDITARSKTLPTFS